MNFLRIKSRAACADQLRQDAFLFDSLDESLVELASTSFGSDFVCTVDYFSNQLLRLACPLLAEVADSKEGSCFEVQPCIRSGKLANADESRLSVLQAVLV